MMTVTRTERAGVRRYVDDAVTLTRALRNLPSRRAIPSSSFSATVNCGLLGGGQVVPDGAGGGVVRAQGLFTVPQGGLEQRDGLGQRAAVLVRRGDGQGL